MNDWFTVEEIDKDTFVISEYKHWEETHCYLLVGSKSALLIDTGLGVSNIKNVVKILTTRPIKVITTHIHWDHIGGHKYFENIGVFTEEKKWLSEKFPIPLSAVRANLFKEDCDFPDDFDGSNYQIYQGEPSYIVYDGDIISLGEREIQVIHTPGHSPGHICFYEKKRQYLFSGDLIYCGCLDMFYPTTDPIKFMDSVKKVKMLPIKKNFPGHHQLHIPTSIIDKIDNGFELLQKENKLIQGSGIFEFENFQIHL